MNNPTQPALVLVLVLLVLLLVVLLLLLLQLQLLPQLLQQLPDEKRTFPTGRLGTNTGRKANCSFSFPFSRSCSVCVLFSRSLFLRWSCHVDDGRGHA